LAPAKKPNNPIYLANKTRIDRYMFAGDQPNARELIQKLRDESIATDREAGIEWPMARSDK
jgi:hypothetical protein